MKTLSDLKQAILENKQLSWNDPDPIDGNDYSICFIEDLHFFDELEEGEIDDCPILIHYNNGDSEAQVFLHEIIVAQ